MAYDQFAYVNKVVMTGHVVRDPEFRHTTSGVPVSNFRIASTRQVEDSGRMREDTCYVGVAAWHDLAEGCRKHLNKGSAILVEGELKSRVRESGDGVRRSFVEIRAQKIRVFSETGDHLELEDTVNDLVRPTGQPGTAPAGREVESPISFADSRGGELTSFNTADREEL
ncbi:MAG: single-stranded DNA-binding protein [Candidatus Zixiibacteriota bacterium]